MRRSRSPTSFSSGSTARKLSSRAFELADLPAELRAAAVRSPSPLLMSARTRRACVCSVGLRRLHVLHVVPVEAAQRRHGDGEEDADLRLPRQFVKTKIHDHPFLSGTLEPLYALRCLAASAAADAGGSGSEPGIANVAFNVNLISSAAGACACFNLAVENLDGLAEVAAAFQVADEIRQRRQRRAAAVDASDHRRPA